MEIQVGKGRYIERGSRFDFDLYRENPRGSAERVRRALEWIKNLKILQRTAPMEVDHKFTRLSCRWLQKSQLSELAKPLIYTCMCWVHANISLHICIKEIYQT